MLQPGKSYLMIYHVMPVIVTGSISSSMPTPNCSISYVDSTGVTRSIVESPRVPVVRDRYIKKRLFFTMPAGDAPIACKVYVSVYSYSIPDDHLRVDNVSLVQMDTNDLPKYGYYAWIGSLNEKLYTEPGGHEVSMVVHTNHYVTIYDQATVNGRLWYLVREFSGVVGWIDADRLVWTSPQLQAGKKYVTLNKDRVWPRNTQFNRCAYHWPKDRRVLVRDHDDSYYETRYGGEIAYLRKEDCEPDATSVVYQLEQRMAHLTGSETGRVNSRYFDNAQGKWDGAFADSMAMAAGVSRSELPCASDTEKSMLYWINTPIVLRFYFWDAEVKRAFRARYPEHTRINSDTITSSENSQKPVVGRWLYFLTSEDRAGIHEGGRLASYVGLITASTAEQYTMLYVHPDTGRVTTAVFPAADRSAVGMAVPNYAFISAERM